MINVGQSTERSMLAMCFEYTRWVTLTQLLVYVTLGGRCTYMRPLKDSELEAVLKNVGDNVQYLLKRSDGTLYCFRFHRNRVFYVKEELVKFAVKFGREQLYSVGTCIGRFTKGRQFLLHVTSLDMISTLGKHKFYVKPSAEQQFLYGHNVTKSGLLRVSDEYSSQYNGVIVVNKNDLPLGFGISAKSSDQITSAQPGQTICLHQADLGEYLRDEGHFNL